MKTLHGMIEVSQSGEDDLRNKLKDIKSKKDLFERLLNILSEGFLVLDQSDKILFMNQCAKVLLDFHNWGAEESIDWSKSILADVIYSTKKLDFLTFHKEIEILVPHLKYLSVSCVSLEMVNNVYRIYMIKDITRQKIEHEQRLMDPAFIDNLTFGAGIAHELGNPIASLSLHTQLLKRMLIKDVYDQNDKGKIDKSLNVLSNELDKLDQTIHQFLDAVRPTNPQFALHTIDEVVGKVILTFDEKAKEKSVGFKFSACEIEPFLMDQTRLQLAITNIILNAIEASFENTEIDIKIDQVKDTCSITIQDYGEGIPSSEMSRIFDPYYTTKKSGNGLGLLMTYRIIKDHGGTISVKSQLKKGTIFVVSIPIRKKAVKLLK